MHVGLLHALEFIVLGVLCGFLGGLFGIGGATLAIPTLGLAFGMNQQLAQGTAIVMAIPNVIVGLVRYAQKAGLDWRTVAVIGASALPTAYLSALVATSLASRPLRIGFAIFVICIALDAGRRALRQRGPVPAVKLPWPVVGLLGAACGAVSGLFGIGGVFVLVPALTAFFGYPQLAAQGMALAFSSWTGIVTAATYASKGDVDWLVALPLAAGGVFAVRRGVDLAHRLPERGLRLSFAVFAIGIGIALLLKA